MQICQYITYIIYNKYIIDTAQAIQIEEGQKEFARHHAELTTKVMDLGINVAEKVRALETKIEEAGTRPAQSEGGPNRRDLGSVKDLHEWQQGSPFPQWIPISMPH